jgi:hypothetical protein
MSTWLERLKPVFGPRGCYENGMRRSLQTVILYEAKRIVAPRLASLRPFQRKAAFLDQAKALIETCDFLFPYQKEEVMWRTAASRQPLTAEMAWKRQKLTEKELEHLSKTIIKPLMQSNKRLTHEQACGMLVQTLFVSRCAMRCDGCCGTAIVNICWCE